MLLLACLLRSLRLKICITQGFPLGVKSMHEMLKIFKSPDRITFVMIYSSTVELHKLPNIFLGCSLLFQEHPFQFRCFVVFGAFVENVSRGATSRFSQNDFRELGVAVTLVETRRRYLRRFPKTYIGPLTLWVIAYQRRAYFDTWGSL